MFVTGSIKEEISMKRTVSLILTMAAFSALTHFNVSAYATDTIEYEKYTTITETSEITPIPPDDAGVSVTVDPPEVSVDSGEVFYGDQIIIYSPEQGHIAYSINGSDYIYSYESQVTIVITGDTELKVKAWVDSLVEGTQYITPEEAYTYTVKNIDSLDDVGEIKYENISCADSGNIIMKNNGSWAYADKNGQPLTGFEYDSISEFSDGLAAVSMDGKYGFINENGELVIPMIYDEVSSFGNGLAAIKQGGTWGYINTDGEIVIQPAYSGASAFSEGYAVVTAQESSTTEIKEINNIIDTEGNTVFSTSSYTIIGKFCEGTAKILSLNDGGIMGLIDSNGSIVLSPEYRMIRDFSEGAAAVLDTTGKYGFIDTKGNKISECIYDAVYDFSEDLAAIQKDGKWGYIDKNGNEVIPPEYDSVGMFSEGLAAVQKDGKWGYIDTAGSEVIPFEYDAAHEFTGGIAAVSEEDKWGIINRENKLLTDFIYDNMKNGVSGDIYVCDNGAWGILRANRYNTEISEYPYSIEALAITNDAGEILVDPPLSSGFIVDVTVKETEERNSRDQLFVAVYDENGVLLSIDYVKTDLTMNSEFSIGFHVPPQDVPVGSIKAYVWSSFESPEPLAETAELIF